MLGYGRQWVDEDDIQAVVEVLRSDRLTQGPVVERFEEALAEYVGADHAVAFNSGTAALHAAYHVAGVKPGTEVLVPAITFAATANAVRTVLRWQTGVCGCVLSACTGHEFRAVRRSPYRAHGLLGHR